MPSPIERLCRLINEVDFDAVTHTVRQDFDQDDFRAQSAFARRIDADFDDVDFQDEATLEDFNEFVAEFSGELVSEAAACIQFDADVSENGIRIWRSIMVDPDWLDDGLHARSVGVCWSFEEDAAECHYGDFSDGLREIRVEAFVDPADVDWPATLRLNAKMDEEKEIRVRDDAFVTVVSAAWIGRRHAGDPGSAVAEIATGPFAAGEAAFSSGLQSRAA
jgi:hypothetical protein